MKQFLPLIALLLTCQFLQSQNVAGVYKDSGYFFHPNIPRVIDQFKTITQVSANKCQLDLGDLGSSSYTLQFEIDANNNLINWTAVNLTPTAPASGFMIADNPGGFSFPVNPAPGSAPFQQSNYSNTYDPATNSFYLHYGVGSIEHEALG